MLGLSTSPGPGLARSPGGTQQRTRSKIPVQVAALGQQSASYGQRSPSPGRSGQSNRNSSAHAVTLQAPAQTSISSRELPPAPRAVSSGRTPRGPTNAPLVILVNQAASNGFRASTSAPLDGRLLQDRLAGCKSFPALQMLAVQHQSTLDQQGVVAMLRRAAQLAAAHNTYSSQDQYACTRFLESIAMSCSPLVPTMIPATVAGVLGTLGALVACGLVQRKGVPYMAVVLVQALILASMPQLHLYTGPQLAHVIRGCALLSPSGIPEMWLDEWEALVEDKLPSLGPDTLTAVLSALDILNTQQQWKPREGWTGAFLDAASGRLADFRGRELREVFLGLVSLGWTPGTEWMGQAKEVLDMRAGAMDAQDLATVLFSMTKMSVKF